MDEGFLNNHIQKYLQDIPVLLVEAETKIKKVKLRGSDEPRFLQPRISKEDDERYVCELKKYIDELNTYKSK